MSGPSENIPISSSTRDLNSAALAGTGTVHLATPVGAGGVSVLLLTGNEDHLRRVEESIPPLRKRPPLAVGEIAYGWLCAAKDSNERIDEVLIAAPARGERIVTGHGGTASALALLRLLRTLGFEETEHAAALCTDTRQRSASQSAPLRTDERTLSGHESEAEHPTAARQRADLERLLPKCRTAAQAELVLRAMNDDSEALERIPQALRPRRWCLCGAPNTGKSSLLNRLCDRQRALVSPLAGTTLDAVEHAIDLGGYDCTLIDTAGFRRCAGMTEQEAIRRARAEIARSDLAACLLDATRPPDEDDRLALTAAMQAPALLLVLNKCDRPCPDWSEGAATDATLARLLAACAPDPSFGRPPPALTRISAAPGGSTCDSRGPQDAARDGLDALLNIVCAFFGGALA